MAVGFKRNNKFIPTGQKMLSPTRKSRTRYANGAGMDQILEQAIRDFASKRKQAYNNYKANQDAKFERELTLRRKFQGKLITAYRQANAQKIRSGRELEKFIRAEIPDLPKDKETAKFVVNVLRDFNKQEEQLEKAKKGKGKEEQLALQKTFDESLTKSELSFKTAQSKRDTEFANQQAKMNKEKEKEIDKLRKEAREADEARKEAEKKAKESAKTQKDPNATQEEKTEAKQEAKQAEQTAQKEEKDETTFADDVAEELKKDTQEVKTEDFSFGFPEEIL